MLRSFIFRWLFNSFGLWLAAELLPGISFNGEWWMFLIAGLIFSIINAIIRPILIILSLPAIVLTLGLFTLVVNSFMLYLVTVFYDRLTVESFSASILAVIIIWIVNFALNTVIKEFDNK